MKIKSLKLILILTIFCIITLNGEIVINEALYDPDGADSGYEWIELYNNGDATIDLFGWKIESAGSEFETNIVFSDSVSIHSHDYFLIAEENIEGADYYHSLDFQNGGSATDGIRIVNPDDYTDTILYDTPNDNNLPDDESEPGTMLLPDVSDGSSLARISNGIDTNQTSDWFESTEPTPGYANCYPIDLEIVEIELIENSNYKINSVIKNNSAINAQENSTSYAIYVNSNQICSEDLPEIPANDSIQFNSQEFSLTDNYSIISLIIEHPDDLNLINNADTLSHLLESPLLINELLFKPSDSNQEWIELKNCSSTTVSNNLILLDAAENSTEFNFSIPPLDYMVICNNKSDLISFYPSVAENKVLEVESLITLNNTEEAIFITDNYSTIFDSIHYNVDNSFPDNYSLIRNGNQMLECPYPSPAEENTIPVDLAIKLKSIYFNSPLITLEIMAYNLSTNDVDNLDRPVDVFMNSQFVSEIEIDSINAKDSLLLEESINYDGNIYSFFEISLNLSNDFNVDNNSDSTAILLQDYPIAINEIMFKPYDEAQEWIEITNISEQDIQIPNFIIQDASEDTNEMNLEIEPEENIVICTNSLSLANNYPNVNQDNLIEIEDLVSLNNSEETITIRDIYDNTFDQQVYSQSSSYPEGISLERVNPYNPESEWTRSTHENGATPTENNSVLLPDSDLQLILSETTLHGNTANHTLSVKNKGINNLADFYLTISQIKDDETTSEIIFEQNYTINTDSTTFDIDTEVVGKGYFTFIYKIINEADQIDGNNQVHGFINKNGLPFVINEIMFAPESEKPEWIEIKKNYEIQHLQELTLTVDEDSLNFGVTDGQFIILTGNSADSLFIKEENNPEAVIFTGLESLSNSGELVFISDKDNNIFEYFSYKPEWSETKGISAERINSKISSTDSNWGPCVDHRGATPGFENSLFTPIIPSGKKLSIDPNPFSPYLNENTIISYELPNKISQITCRIFDLKGRCIRKIKDQELSSASGNIIWNGARDNGSKAKPGIYLILFEATSYNSEKSTNIKETIVIAK